MNTKRPTDDDRTEADMQRCRELLDKARALLMDDAAGPEAVARAVALAQVATQVRLLAVGSTWWARACKAPPAAKPRNGREAAATPDAGKDAPAEDLFGGDQ